MMPLHRDDLGGCICASYPTISKSGHVERHVLLYTRHPLRILWIDGLFVSIIVLRSFLKLYSSLFNFFFSFFFMGIVQIEKISCTRIASEFGMKRFHCSKL